MPVGLETYDTAGKVLLSTDVLTFFLRRTGSGTTVAPDAGNTPPSMIQIPVNINDFGNPMIAIACESPVAFLGRNPTNGNPRYGCAGGGGVTYNYYLFDYSPTVPAGTFGLETFNASGQRAFSSAQRAMKPLTLLTDSRVSDTGDPFPSVTYAGKSLAVVPPAWAGWLDWPAFGTCYDNGPAGEDWTPGQACADLEIEQDSKMLGGKVTNSGQTASIDKISFDDVIISTSSTEYAAHVDHNYPLRLIVVDVTGIPIGQVFY